MMHFTIPLGVFIACVYTINPFHSELIVYGLVQNCALATELPQSDTSHWHVWLPMESW